MKTYKYTDATNTVVHVIDEDGISRMSMLASALPEGTVVEPADPPAPLPPKQLTSLEFLDLFTEEEQLNIAGAAMTHVQAKLWYDRTMAASFITLADPRTEIGLDFLVSADLLSAERKAEIVGNMR